ncbi:MAG: hypothetical protein ABI629_13690 [bacterium]
MARRRLLSVCRGVPEWGDANPWAYALHAVLGAAGFDAVLVNLLTDSDAVYFRHALGEHCEDPYQLGGVQRCALGESARHGDVALAEIVASLAPDVAVAWDVDTARLLRQAAVQLPLVLVGTRCARLERLIADGAVRDFLGFRSAVDRGVIFSVGREDPELDAIQACDLLILPSLLARTAQEHLFPAHAGKMYDRTISAAEPLDAEARRFHALRRPFAERDIDVSFVAGRWDAPARGLPLVDRICARFPGRHVALVGECASPTGARHLGMLPRRALYEILGRSKVVVVPGLADPAPAGWFEASAMECNLVASPNCGPWDLCPEELRVDDASSAAFVERIERALARPMPDHRQRFLDGGTDELVETLAAI